MSESTLVVKLPIDPPSILSPNSRAHHMEKYRASKTIRDAARAATQSALADATASPAPGSPVSIGYMIGWSKGRKRMDDDNALAMCKAIRDGVADALGGSDATFSSEGVAQRRDPEGIGFTLIRLNWEHPG